MWKLRSIRVFVCGKIVRDIKGFVSRENKTSYGGYSKNIVNLLPMSYIQSPNSISSLQITSSLTLSSPRPKPSNTEFSLPPTCILLPLHNPKRGHDMYCAKPLTNSPRDCYPIAKRSAARLHLTTQLDY
jgi:hypothetical protein